MSMAKRNHYHFCAKPHSWPLYSKPIMVQNIKWATIFQAHKTLSNFLLSECSSVRILIGKLNTTERLVRESKGKIEEDGREWKLQSR